MPYPLFKEAFACVHARNCLGPVSATCKPSARQAFQWGASGPGYTKLATPALYRAAISAKSARPQARRTQRRPRLRAHTMASCRGRSSVRSMVQLMLQLAMSEGARCLVMSSKARSGRSSRDSSFACRVGQGVDLECLVVLWFSRVENERLPVRADMILLKHRDKSSPQAGIVNPAHTKDFNCSTKFQLSGLSQQKCFLRPD